MLLVSFLATGASGMLEAGASNVEQKVLSEVESAQSRLALIQDQTQGTPALHPDAADRLLRSGLMEWVLPQGRVTAEPIRVGPAELRVVSTRSIGPSWQSQLKMTSGRPARAGEAVLASDVAHAMGLTFPLGVIESKGWPVPIVGFFDRTPAERDLLPEALTVLDEVEPVRIAMSIRPGVNLSVVELVVTQLSQPTDLSSVAYQQSANLQQLQLAISGELGRSNRTLVLTISTGLLLFVVLMGAAAMKTRSQYLGLLRCNGFSRTRLFLVVITALALPAILGAATATAAVRVLGEWRHWETPSANVVAVAVASVLATVCGLFPAVLIACLRDPVRVLRRS